MADTVLFMVCVEGRPMRLSDRYPDAPAKGLLLTPLDARATAFTSYGRAQTAIKRTVRYAEANGLAWPIRAKGQRRIVRVHVNA